MHFLDLTICESTISWILKTNIMVAFKPIMKQAGIPSGRRQNLYAFTGERTPGVLGMLRSAVRICVHGLHKDLLCDLGMRTHMCPWATVAFAM